MQQISKLSGSSGPMWDSKAPSSGGIYGPHFVKFEQKKITLPGGYLFEMLPSHLAFLVVPYNQFTRGLDTSALPAGLTRWTLIVLVSQFSLGSSLNAVVIFNLEVTHAARFALKTTTAFNEEPKEKNWPGTRKKTEGFEPKIADF